MRLVEKYALKTCNLSSSVNYLKIPVSNVPITEEGATTFNEFYQFFLESGYSQIKRTPSGGISVAKKWFRPPMWDVQVKKAYVEITVVDYQCYRLQFSNFSKEGEQGISGRRSFLTFKAVCNKFGIDLSEFEIENGEEVKKEIEKPKIELFVESGQSIENCHHLDFNSSHISGMVKYHPALKGPFEEIYSKRKDNSIYKQILTHCWGYLQSEYIGYKFAHISRDGIKYTNERIEEMSKRLVESGRRLVAWNTDGIWYQGDIYHADDEGIELGQWKNDHTNCLFRAKSKGSYEFIEDGKYTPVVRGATRLDKIKSRDQWKWGDIFNTEAEIIRFAFDPRVGIVKEGQ